MTRRSPKNSTEPAYKNNANPTRQSEYIFCLHQPKHKPSLRSASTQLPLSSKKPVSQLPACPPPQPNMNPTLLSLLLAITAAVSAAPIPQNQGPFDGLVSPPSIRQATSYKSFENSHLTSEKGYGNQRRRQFSNRRRARHPSRRGECCLGVDGCVVVGSL
jgi:hypothetical protein